MSCTRHISLTLRFSTLSSFRTNSSTFLFLILVKQINALQCCVLLSFHLVSWTHKTSTFLLCIMSAAPCFFV